MLEFCGEERCLVDGNGRIRLNQRHVDDFLRRCNGEVVMYVLPEGAVAGPDFSITADLLDTNHHVNNVRSVALAMRFLPEDFAFTALAVDYHHPLLPHTVVTPLCASTDRGFVVALTAGGRTCVSAEFIR